MQFINFITLASFALAPLAALATPVESGKTLSRRCTPGTYECVGLYSGGQQVGGEIEICNSAGQYVLSADCGPAGCTLIDNIPHCL